MREAAKPCKKNLEKPQPQPQITSSDLDIREFIKKCEGYIRRNYFDKAHTLIEQRLEEEPTNTYCYYLLGQWHEKKGELEEALEKYREALVLMEDKTRDLIYCQTLKCKIRSTRNNLEYFGKLKETTLENFLIRLFYTFFILLFWVIPLYYISKLMNTEIFETLVLVIWLYLFINIIISSIAHKYFDTVKQKVKYLLRRIFPPRLYSYNINDAVIFVYHHFPKQRKKHLEETHIKLILQLSANYADSPKPSQKRGKIPGDRAHFIRDSAGEEYSTFSLKFIDEVLEAELYYLEFIKLL